MCSIGVIPYAAAHAGSWSGREREVIRQVAPCRGRGRGSVAIRLSAPPLRLLEPYPKGCAHLLVEHEQVLGAFTL